MDTLNVSIHAPIKFLSLSTCQLASVLCTPELTILSGKLPIVSLLLNFQKKLKHVGTSKKYIMLKHSICFDLSPNPVTCCTHKSRDKSSPMLVSRKSILMQS